MGAWKVVIDLANTVQTTRLSGPVRVRTEKFFHV